MEAIKIRVTRNPRRRKRRFKLFKLRLPDLDFPGSSFLELDDLFVGLAFVLIALLLIVIGAWLGGLMVAVVELVVLSLLAVGRWSWALLRGHPKLAVVELNDQRWIKNYASDLNVDQDTTALQHGVDPESLGYRLSSD